MKISILGMGYVGLPLAILADKKGHDVFGLDIDLSKINNLKDKKVEINDPEIKKGLALSKINFTNDFSKIKESDVSIVCVPTPIKENNLPDLSYIESAVNIIQENLKSYQLVVIESTIYPGTCEEILKPILDRSNKSYYLAHCPERINPGDKKWNVTNLPRVIAGIDKESTNKAVKFYNSLLDAEIKELTNIRSVEAVKIMENTFRDVNIAFVNEMAKSFDLMGIDIMEVISGASTKPFGFLPHYPGAGVGGHCIAVDPYYLIERARIKGFNHKFLKLAREINNSMPNYIIELLQKYLDEHGISIKNARIGVLGISYKSNVSDTRRSPSFDILEILSEKKAKLNIYDPFVLHQSTVKSLDELLNKSDFLILVTSHTEFKKIEEFKKLRGIKLIIDGRNFLDKKKIKLLGVEYKGIGM